MFIPPAFDRLIAYNTSNRPSIGTACVFTETEPVNVTATFILEDDLQEYLIKYGGENALYSYTQNVYVRMNMVNKPFFSISLPSSPTAQRL